ncbi:MAG: AMP-binding protein [Acetobacter sp.]|uniref:AMP-binding protein n=1 Tax=Acetobacter sp. TaxID=440 RepID=UPI0039E7AC62
MFWQDYSDGAEDRVFLIEGENHYRYSDIFRLGDEFFAHATRAVAIILCDRTHLSVAAYFGALRHGVVPLLLDGSIKRPVLSSTIQAYAPRYIIGDLDSVPDGYAVARQVGSKVFFERIAPVAYPLNDDLALLIPTSGSTGDPKCVRLTGRNIESCTRSIVEYLSFTPERVTVSLLPFHYSYGLSVLHNTAFVRGAMLLTEQSVLEKDLWTRMEEAGVTDISGVPFTFETLRRIRLSDKILNNLRCVTQAGGRLTPALTQHFWQYFADHGVRYFTMYGQTEAAPRISYVPPERALEKLGSVGIPIPGGKVEIVEAIQGGGDGELVYEGRNVSMGYATSWGDLAQGDCFGGRLHTGDLARIDSDGFITIVGRKKRFIKLHGISVNLDHVESTLRNAGATCMVVGKENCMVICVQSESMDIVQAVMKDNFNFHPTAVRLEICESFPLTASHKPDYTALSQRYKLTT